MTQSSETLRPTPTSKLTRDLFFGVGRLDIDLVTTALDAGADINHCEENPVYVDEEIDDGLWESPLRHWDEATPLLAALLYQDYKQIKQKQLNPDGSDKRAVIVRFLIERDADLLATCNGVPLFHRVFEDIECERKYLEIFFDYPDRIDFNARDSRGRTVFLAACSARVRFDPWPNTNAYFEFEDRLMTWEDPVEERWDSTGLFLKMIEYGADIMAVDNEGNNALARQTNHSHTLTDVVLTLNVPACPPVQPWCPQLPHPNLPFPPLCKHHPPYSSKDQIWPYTPSSCHPPRPS